jgi:hypothetical protein
VAGHDAHKANQRDFAMTFTLFRTKPLKALSQTAPALVFGCQADTKSAVRVSADFEFDAETRPL